MFCTAYVRGLQTALVNADRAAFPSEDVANKVADYIAERADLNFDKAVPAETNLKIANQIIEASEWLKKQPSFKAAGWNKLATWDDVLKVAQHHVDQLFSKAAEGSTIEGGDKGNQMPQSPNGEQKMDLGQRPMGYATDSRGKTDVDTRPGAIGKEEEQPNAPARSDAKANSVEEQSKTSSLADMFKAAAGSTIMGGDKGNMPTQAVHSEAKMDQAQRPVGYATFGMGGVGGLGAVMNEVKGPALVGRETANPNAPARSDDKSNSVMQTTAKAAAEDPFVTLFKKVAAEVVEYLPAHMDDNAKIAAVRACMGLTTNEKFHYLNGLQKEAAVKVAGVPAAVPPGSRGDNYTQHSPDATHSRPGAYDGRKNNQANKTAEDGDLPPFMMAKKDDEKKDEDKGDEGDKKDMKKDDEKKDEGGEGDKKEASLRDMFSRIRAAQQGA
jgi:hypothetical protein